MGDVSEVLVGYMSVCGKNHVENLENIVLKLNLLAKLKQSKHWPKCQNYAWFFFKVSTVGSDRGDDVKTLVKIFTAFHLLFF